jgi:hypothetical protein
MATASNIRAGRAFVELTLDQTGLERGNTGPTGYRSRDRASQPVGKK